MSEKLSQQREAWRNKRYQPKQWEERRPLTERSCKVKAKLFLFTYYIWLDVWKSQMYQFRNYHNNKEFHRVSYYQYTEPLLYIKWYSLALFSRDEVISTTKSQWTPVIPARGEKNWIQLCKDNTGRTVFCFKTCPSLKHHCRPMLR